MISTTKNPQLLTSFNKDSAKLQLFQRDELNIQKTKTMASGPIISNQIHGETMKTVTDFIFLGLKITVDGDCSHEMKRYLLLGRKAMTNLDSILKGRDISLLEVFQVVMYGCENWNIKLSIEKLMLLNCGIGEDS